VILRAELMGWRASCFFNGFSILGGFLKMGGPPNHSSPTILLNRMVFGIPPCSEPPHMSGMMSSYVMD
jgi:hypothetical protein